MANTGPFGEDTGDPDVLYLNDGGDNHWLQVQLKAASGNHAAIGARIEVSAGDLHQIREVSGGRGYAQNSSIVNVGLGANTSARTVKVIWPSGTIETLRNVAADQLVIINEGEYAPVNPQDKVASTWGKARQTDDFLYVETASSEVGQNYPNPFNPETWIPYQLSQSGEVTFSIYNSVGQLVRRLDIGYRTAGGYISQEKAAYWDGKTSAGEYASSGVYFYRIQTAQFAATGKMMLTK